MYTQCSTCASLFRITSQHLRQAQGLVRCCLCHSVFDALPSLAEALPAALQVHLAMDEPEQAAAASRPQPAAVEDDLFITLPRAVLDPSTAPAVPAGPASRRPGPVAWASLFLLLAVVLAIPYAYLMREELGRYPRLRPWLDSLCAVAGCDLSLLRDASRIHILYKDVGFSAASPAGLVMRATLVSDTAFRQPYPQIRFSFLSPTGAAHASRWFSPDEYLSEQQRAEIRAGMPPQEPVSIRLTVADINPAAADNFMIELR
jgi:predicted Zn finger-like uncharacterized protein